MAGFRIREEMSGAEEAPGKTWFWELEAGVIDAGRCIQCGACVAVCPSDSIGIGGDDLPKLVKMCTGCSLCWDFCPRGGLRYEATWPLIEETPVAISGRRNGNGSNGKGKRRAGDAKSPPSEGREPDWQISGGPAHDGLGVLRDSYTARVAAGMQGAQDGGVVSAILMAALDAGHLDGVLLAREDDDKPWKGVAHLARTPEEVAASAGSFYNQTMALGHLDLDRHDLPPEPRIAVVGTPCEVQGIRAMQARPWRWGKSRVEAVVLTIALLCTKSFDYRGLMLRELRDERGLLLSQVGKVDVIHGRMIVEDREGNRLVDEPVRDFHGAALKGCDECADFLGHGADISVGSVGSEEGYSSVLVRTEPGRAAFELARDRLEVRGLDSAEPLHKLSSFDKKVALQSLQRP
ncbi:MAG TPA: Coenzyme F420 hydrogenase/dehydrogenase, beta subunit C-terminal domain, partial [Acidimicrobiales bacterium]|nr:Coenzyme F420 hydrogenase/dehydrogenase, beta subunit C-terminal domain [Acidimicrobiales bacterium]